MPKKTEEVAQESDVDRLVGQNIQQLRVAKQMSQAQLAETMTARMGQPVAQQTILKIEKGTRPLRYVEAVALADALDVPLDALAPDRQVVRERVDVEIAAIETSTAYSYLVEALIQYETSSSKLRLAIHESPYVEKAFTPTELEQLRWLAEGTILDAARAMHTAIDGGPQMPSGYKRLF